MRWIIGIGAAVAKDAMLRLIMRSFLNMVLPEGWFLKSSSGHLNSGTRNAAKI
jgi:hypothetical protein